MIEASEVSAKTKQSETIHISTIISILNIEKKSSVERLKIKFEMDGNYV